MACKRLTGTLSPIGVLTGFFQPPRTLSGTIDRVIRDVEPIDYYDGAYEATPTRSTQVFDTAGLAMRYSFVVNPIPQNYGLITWDGAAMTVS